MSNYSYTTGIPNGSLTPAQNRPTMTQNNDSNNSIWTEDHNGFNDNVGGSHQFMRMPNFTAPAVLSETATQGSVIYTAAGTADATKAQGFFKNPNVTLQLCPIRAWGYCIGTNGAVIAGQSVNVSATTGANGQYTITLSANTVSSVNYMILTSATQRANGSGHGMVANYSIISTTQFQILTFDPIANSVQAPFSFTFAVIQL